MAGCSASLCVGVCRVRGPPLLLSAGFSRSLLFFFTHRSPVSPYSLSLYLSLLLSFSSSILSSLWRALTVGLWYLQIQIPDFPGAITQSLSFSGPPVLRLLLFHLVSSLVPSLSFPSRQSFVRSFVLLFCRALSESFCNVCNGPPTPGIPRWVSNTYLHGRGTTVSVQGSVDPVHTPRSPRQHRRHRHRAH